MRIAVDLDDTLINFAEQLILFHNSIFNTNYVLPSFHTYTFWEVWGGDKETNREEMFKYYNSDHFSSIKPMSGALSVVSELSRDNELIIITVRHEATSDLTKKQVQSLFPGIFKEIYFAKHPFSPSDLKTKTVLCDELSVDVLIEDSADNANACVKDDRKVFLFNRPWNINRETDQRIIRVDSWEEILNQL